MYYYIVDAARVSPKEFERVQSNLYSSISEYHISGEVVRVTGIRTIKQLVETAFFHQAKTIVAVGTDDTLNEVINIVGEREITIGFIPLIKTELSEVLGIPDIPQACKFLAVRRVENIDLGVVNDSFFISKLSFGRKLESTSKLDVLGFGFANNIASQTSFEIKFKVDGKYTASSSILAGAILNTRAGDKNGQTGNPTDGQLDLLLLPTMTKVQAMAHRRDIQTKQFENIPNCSIIHFKELEILAPVQIPLMGGNVELTLTPAKITIKTKAIKIIVGRNRTF